MFHLVVLELLEVQDSKDKRADKNWRKAVRGIDKMEVAL